MSSRLLDYEVTVKRQRLGTGQRGVVGVEVRPARLHHAQSWVREEVGKRLEQKVGMGAEVSVEDGDVLATGLR